jgi:hypothetical protein
MINTKVFELRENDAVYKKYRELEKIKNTKINDINLEFQKDLIQLQSNCIHNIDGFSTLKGDGSNSRKMMCVLCFKLVEI